MGNNLNNPHDKFFKASFGRTDLVREFLQNYLPDELKELINYEELELESSTYIDQELRECYYDLLYRSKIKNEEVYLYLLFEHKSYPDKWCVLQLLNYMTRIWMRVKEEKHHDDRLPIVIPILFFNGRDGKYIKKRFGEYFVHTEAFNKFLPLFEVLFYDFSAKSNTRIFGSLKLKYLLEIMKRINAKDVKPLYKKISYFSVRIKDSSFVIKGIKYVLEARPDFDYDYFISLVKQGEEGTNVMKSLYDRIIEEGKKEGLEVGIKEGKKEGIEEGMKEGKKEVAITMLKDGMNIEKIAKFTKLDMGEIELLKKEIQH